MRQSFSKADRRLKSYSAVRKSGTRTREHRTYSKCSWYPGKKHGLPQTRHDTNVKRRGTADQHHTVTLLKFHKTKYFSDELCKNASVCTLDHCSTHRHSTLCTFSIYIIRHQLTERKQSITLDKNHNELSGQKSWLIDQKRLKKCKMKLKNLP